DVIVKLHGACRGCVHATDTLRSVVQETLRQEVSADINVIEAK
ncbi:MAG: NifU family protein, partial [Candidatus Riflebacteria bacterium]|nr:NifU family protein [Candidatus Riflebacteria bacterium]